MRPIVGVMDRPGEAEAEYHAGLTTSRRLAEESPRSLMTCGTWRRTPLGSVSSGRGVPRTGPSVIRHVSGQWGESSP
jgi:hypothetical protein